MLPSLVILKANEDRYVLLSLSIHSSSYIDAVLVENSKYLFTNAEWRTDGLAGLPQTYIFRRVSSRSPQPKTYNSTLCKTSGYLIVSWHEPIHIYTMTYSGISLPSTYFKVFKDRDQGGRWHFKKPLPGALPAAAPAPAAPAPVVATPPTIVKIPSHIVRGFVESAIQKKEVCPITLEPLVMGHVAMTSCGHLFNTEAIMNMLKENTSCPSCRCVIKDDLVLN
jgi:hypothetical protein